MRLFLHLIYEYRKGLRKLVLYTTRKSIEAPIRAKLVQHGISHEIHDIGRGKVNVFFGDADCVEVVRMIGKRNVARYTDEEDFILGSMLGYDIVQQCRRYVKRRGRPNEKNDRRPPQTAAVT
jgi:Protein of unknown function (DUF2023)